MLAFLKAARELAAKRKANKQDAAERRAIAKAFNDRYTYRVEWIKGMPQLPGTAMFGLNPRAGFAWMCPECNRIHHPVESSVFSGLQYPACCAWPEGNRLGEDIQTPKSGW